MDCLGTSSASSDPRVEERARWAKGPRRVGLLLQMGLLLQTSLLLCRLARERDLLRRQLRRPPPPTPFDRTCFARSRCVPLSLAKLDPADGFGLRRHLVPRRPIRFRTRWRRRRSRSPSRLTAIQPPLPTSSSPPNLGECDSLSLARFSTRAFLPLPPSSYPLTPSFPSPEFVRSHRASLLRFITLVVRPVGEVFGLDPRSLHIFHDLSGPLIAFNRNGSLYLNLRYYLAWHDEAVVRGELAEALISVFHTLAQYVFSLDALWMRALMRYAVRSPTTWSNLTTRSTRSTFRACARRSSCAFLSACSLGRAVLTQRGVQTDGGAAGKSTGGSAGGDLRRVSLDCTIAACIWSSGSFECVTC